ncbi:MAG: hypothetical protein Q8O14_14795 [bacterium]|nr:hypothetical protein [bacterium]
MIHPLTCLALVAITVATAIIWFRIHLRRRLASDRALWRRSLARGLSDAALPTAAQSEAAAAVLTLLAEVILGTGEMGHLEAAVLRERVQEGAALDDKRARESLLLRMANMLNALAGARELLAVMHPETRRDATLRDDAVTTLDVALSAYRGDEATPPPNAHHQ